MGNDTTNNAGDRTSSRCGRDVRIQDEGGGDAMCTAIVVRFSGDSGDGMQIIGDRFTHAAATAGQDLMTFPDFPAEIRSPAGTTSGVSSFQIQLGSDSIHTPGDVVDVLVALNPASLKINIENVREGGLVIVDTGSFTEGHWLKAGYVSDPLSGTLAERFRVMSLPITELTQKACEGAKISGISKKIIHRARNMWVLGLILSMFHHKPDDTTDWIRRKFAHDPSVANMNLAALEGGLTYASVSELVPPPPSYTILPAKMDGGSQRTITGTEAMCWGLITGATLADNRLIYCSYPITPASAMLHLLSRLEQEFDIEVLQAEDEIASVCAALGASYGGRIGVTASSGPGMSLKSEALGLAVATELPLVVIDVQRGGPSTGLPTKTEQSDLQQALYGRSGDAPVCVLAAHSPGNCFFTAIEAIHIATRFMTPVILLSDCYLANASELWELPDIRTMPSFQKRASVSPSLSPLPYDRDPETLARPWLPPGTQGGIHRIGGLEREDKTGNPSYDPRNHERMTLLRHEKIARVCAILPPQKVELGSSKGDLAILGWGSTFGSIHHAVKILIAQGYAVSHIHVRHIHPLPTNLFDLLEEFSHILIPEMNMGQFATLLRSRSDRAYHSFCHVTGQPFKVANIVERAKSIIENQHSHDA